MPDRSGLKVKLHKALSMRKTGLMWHFRVGCCVDELMKASISRTACMREIAGKPGESRAGLYRALKLAQMYPGREIETVKKLPWMVVRALLAVENDKKRGELQRRASEEGWSARKTQREITAWRGKKLEARGDRRHQRKDVSEDLIRLAAATREWQGLVRDIWPHERFQELLSDGAELAGLVDRVSRAMAPLIETLKRLALPY